MYELYPEQSAAVDRLIEIGRRSKVSCNLSDTGTGKTLMLLELARRQGLRPFVVVPKAGVSQFTATAQFQEVPLVGCSNIEKLKTGKLPQLRRMDSGKHKYLWQLPRGSMVCIDEAHRFGGIDSDNADLMAMLKAYPELSVHLMSATLADSPLKLRAPGFLMGLHPYEEQQFYRWCQTLGCSVNPWTQRWAFDKTALRAQYLQQLHEQIAPFSVRLRKEEIEGFPECETYAQLVDLTAREAEEIQQLYAELRDVVRTCDGATKEVELLRRRQRAEFLKAGVIADLVEDLYEEEKSVVVFTCFRETLFAIERRLMEADIACVKIIGGQSTEQRDAAKLAFQQNLVPVCLAMIQAGGIAIDLHDKEGKQRESLICPDWNAVNTVQALGRIHRAGGKSKAIQRFLLAAQTIEEDVYQAVMRKTGNMKHINDGFIADSLEQGFAEQGLR